MPTWIASGTWILFPIIFFMSLFGRELFAQGIGISESSITPDAHAILELRSTLRGFLAPRMTTVQRGTLGAVPPSSGMLVYDTDTKSFWYYDNGGWNAIAAGTGVGTVTNFSAGDLTPLFTTTETNTTTTPALSFSLSNAGAYTIFGNNTNGSAAPSFFTPALASALFQNQGTTTTVLHGNAAGNPSWGQIVNSDITAGTIDLTTKVTGVLPPSNGGTGVANNALSTLTVSGNFATTFSLTGTTNVTLPTSGTLMANPMTTGGDIIYGGASGAPARLANGTAGQVLKSNGTTLAPSWITPNAGTVTSVSTAAANNGVTATWSMASPTPALTIGLGAITPTSVNGLTFSALGTGFTVAGGTTSKTLTVSNTLGFSGTDGSTLNIGSGGTLGSNAFSSTAYAPLASPTFTGTVTIPTPFTLGAVSMTSTGTQLNYLNAASGTTGTTSSSLVFSNSPTLVTPALGTPSALVGTNITGTAASLTAGTANNLSGGSGGTIPYQTSAGTTSMLANGTAGQVLKSNGTTLAPSWITPNAGTVTSVSTAAANNGVTATWSMASPTPALTIGLGDITPASVNGLTLSELGSGFTVAGGTTSKTLTVTNTLGLSGTDGSTLNIGSGGTLGSNAFTSTAYAPLASPTFTGTVSIPSPFTLGGVSMSSTGSQLNYLNAATGTTGTTSSSVVFSASPTFTGTPTLPTGTIATTQTFGDNSTAVATTAFVQSETPVFARVTGANATTTTQTLTNIAGLTFAAAAGSTYEFEAVLSVGTSNVTTGTGYGVQYTGTASAIEGQIAGSSSTTATKTLRISALGTSYQAFLTTSNQTGGMLIRGIIVTTTAGNLTIQHLKVTSGTSTVYVNSFLKVTKIQ
jgi:hypothetical protein